MYHTEPLLAEAFGEAFKAGVVRREDLIVTTKLDPYEEDPVASLKKSLRWLPNPYSLLL
jgi:diketogulonate reductase-like aldo/keto reductase